MAKIAGGLARVIRGSNGVSLTVAGSVPIYEMPTGVVLPTGAGVLVQAVSGLTVNPTFSIGTNAPDYDNILPAATPTNLGTLFQSHWQTLESKRGIYTTSIPGGVTAYLRVVTPATAGSLVVWAGIEVLEIQA